MTSLSETSVITAGVATGEGFGSNCNARGDYLVGYAHNYTGSGLYGCVHLWKYVNSTWTKQLNIFTHNSVNYDFLFNPNNTTQDLWRFGVTCDVSANGTYICAGEHNNSSSATLQGKIHLFQLQSGKYVNLNITQPSFGSQYDLIAFSCSLNDAGDVMVVGAHYEDGSYANNGAFSIYTRSGTTWTYNTTNVYSPSGVAETRFGRCVRLSYHGDFLLSSQPADTVVANRNVFLYARSGTTATYNLIGGIKTAVQNAGETLLTDNLGDVRTCDIYDRYAVCGSNAGFHVVEITGSSGSYGISHVQTVTEASLGDGNSSAFGYACAIYGLTICACDQYYNTNYGKGYVYKLNPSGTPKLTLLYTLETGSAGSYLGQDTAILNDHIFVGSALGDGKIYHYFQSICFVSGSKVKTETGYKLVENLKRGDMIWTEHAGFQPLARLIASEGTAASIGTMILFKKDSLGVNCPSEDFIITKGHPVFFNNNYYNPEDFVANDAYENVIEVDGLAEKLYTLQFEEHHVINVNGMKITSLPPYTNYKSLHLPEEMYFDKSKFNKDHIGKQYKPYMLHDDPLMKFTLK